MEYREQELLLTSINVAVQEAKAQMLAKFGRGKRVHFIIDSCFGTVFDILFDKIKDTLDKK